MISSRILAAVIYERHPHTPSKDDGFLMILWHAVFLTF
ncbi:hypothetical protein WM42_1932 [Corynebacterium simulans]|nr:hypothetical protein WM42_1932 [Corynebacterium simulans]